LKREPISQRITRRIEPSRSAISQRALVWLMTSAVISDVPFSPVNPAIVVEALGATAQS
jgi:hypothetical protein